MNRFLRLPRRFHPAADAWIRFWRGWQLRRVVSSREFYIVACNCWGGFVYQDMKRPYTAPFAGLYLLPESYLRFVENYAEARSARLEFVSDNASPFPVGRLPGGIEIHFAHYPTEVEAREKWERRCARLPERLEDCHLMFCDRDGCTDAQIERFMALPASRKVFFTAHSRTAFPQLVIVPPQEGGPGVDEAPHLYLQSARHFDLAHWLNTGQVRH